MNFAAFIPAAGAVGGGVEDAKKSQPEAEER
jgi:hypothetical protein